MNADRVAEPAPCRPPHPPTTPTAGLLLALLLPLATGCMDGTTNDASIGFVYMRGQGGAWPYLIELGDSTAMYSEALGSGWSGPIRLFASVERPERFRWHSSDSTVLAVDARGVVRARGLGQAAIHAVVDTVASDPWSLRVIPAGLTSVGLVEVPERSALPRRAFAVTAHDAAGRSVPGVPFYAVLLLPGRSPTIRCAETPSGGAAPNIAPCDVLVDGSLVTEPVRLRVIVPTMIGESEGMEAEVVVEVR